MSEQTDSPRQSKTPLLVLILGAAALTVVGYFVAPGGGETAQVALIYPPGATIVIDGAPAAGVPQTQHLNMPELKGTIYQLPRGDHAVEVTLADGAVVSGSINADPDHFGSKVYQAYPDKGIALRK
ncbi:MAG: hypothetical protein HQK87_07025 [Nitrospinae bacterium]|nr:hypothetical protein [Nitrospinota bacterium]